MAEIALSLPFSLNAYGQITTTESQSKIWADRVLSVIGTNINERVMLGGYGTNITSYAFGSIDRAVAAIPGEVEKAFGGFLPALTYVETKIDVDAETGTMLLDIMYQLPNGAETQTVVEIVAIASKNPPVQETV